LPDLGRVVVVLIRVDDEKPQAQMHVALHPSRGPVVLNDVSVRSDGYAIRRDFESPFAQVRSGSRVKRGDAEREEKARLGEDGHRMLRPLDLPNMTFAAADRSVRWYSCLHDCAADRHRMVVWFVLAALSTAYVAYDQFAHNPEAG
jgi:hypothetical protein